jgi:molybdopterin-guanine dinucleotide biosynthesis protein A
MIERCGGIIFCGGESLRMGQAKAWLPFGGETLLGRVVRQLQGVVSPVVVVGAAGSPLPTLPASVEIAFDRQPGRGPLEGLCVGLAALADRAPIAFAVGCDYPFVAPGFMERMAMLAVGRDMAIVRTADRLHPLAGIYSTALEARCDELLAAGQSRLLDLVEVCDARHVDSAELVDVDPRLGSLQNINTPAEYAAALAAAGFRPAESPPAAAPL